jgi:predicted  nucleic acid-binding Zn ribbon protein
LNKNDWFTYEKYNNLPRKSEVNNQVRGLTLEEYLKDSGDINQSEETANQIAWRVLYQEYVSKCNEITESKGLPLEEWRTF